MPHEEEIWGGDKEASLDPAAPLSGGPDSQTTAFSSESDTLVFFKCFPKCLYLPKWVAGQVFFFFFINVAMKLGYKRDTGSFPAPVPSAVVSVRLEVTLLVWPLAVWAVVGVHHVVAVAPLHLQLQVPLTQSKTCVFAQNGTFMGQHAFRQSSGEVGQGYSKTRYDGAR